MSGTKGGVPIDVNPATPTAGHAEGANAVLGPLESFVGMGNLPTTRGATVWVKCAGTAYSTVVLEGSFDGTVYVTAKDFAWVNAAIAATGTTHLALGASYPYLRITCTGGAGDSTIDAAVIV